MKKHSIELNFSKWQRTIQSLKPLIYFRNFLVICSDSPTKEESGLGNIFWFKNEW